MLTRFSLKHAGRTCPFPARIPRAASDLLSPSFSFSSSCTSSCCGHRCGGKRNNSLIRAQDRRPRRHQRRNSRPHLQRERHHRDRESGRQREDRDGKIGHRTCEGSVTLRESTARSTITPEMTPALTFFIGLVLLVLLRVGISRPISGCGNACIATLLDGAAGRLQHRDHLAAEQKDPARSRYSRRHVLPHSPRCKRDGQSPIDKRHARSGGRSHPQARRLLRRRRAGHQSGRDDRILVQIPGLDPAKIRKRASNSRASPSSSSAWSIRTTASACARSMPARAVIPPEYRIETYKHAHRGKREAATKNAAGQKESRSGRRSCDRIERLLRERRLDRAVEVRQRRREEIRPDHGAMSRAPLRHRARRRDSIRAR